MPGMCLDFVPLYHAHHDTYAYTPGETAYYAWKEYASPKKASCPSLVLPVTSLTDYPHRATSFLFLLLLVL